MESKDKKIMYIHAASQYRILEEIVKDVMVVLRDGDLYEELREIKSFDLSSDNNDGIVTGKEIADMIFRYNEAIFVYTYRSWNPFSRVNGYFDPRKSTNAVYLNSRRFSKRSYEDIAETLIHEIIHVIDYNIKGSSFGHDGNSSRGKKNTAPWKVAKIAASYINLE